MELVDFQYRLTGSGWSEARLQVGDAFVELSASYLADALGDLVRGAVAVTRGAHQVHVSWLEEPGEFRWVLTPDHASVTVRVLWFDDWGSHEDEQGRELFVASCGKAQFRAAIAKGAQDVLKQHGVAGYKDLWVQHDFPTEALRELLLSAS